MRKQTMLIVAPLCVVVLAAGVAVAAPSSPERVSDARLDNPHPVRPIAADPTVVELTSLSAMLDQAASFVRDVQAGQIHDFLQDVQNRQIIDFLNAVVAGNAAPARSAGYQQNASATSGDPGGGGGGDDFLSCVRQRESRGDYSVHNTGGSGASGAYQFMPGTWNAIAGEEGRSDLVGVDPAAAAPGDQDAMAQALYAQQGASPWGGGC